MIEFTEEFGVKNVAMPVDGGIVRPPKIGWRSINENIQTIDAQFRSNHDYKSFQTNLRQAQNKGVRFTTEKPTPELFQKFFVFYRDYMSNMPNGRMKLPEDWLERHAAKHEETLGYFAYFGDEMMGGALAFVEDGGKVIHVGFLVGSHKYRGITTGLQNELLKDVIARKVQTIHYGKDTNLYGIALNPGLAFSKIRFGFEPYILADFPPVHTFLTEMPTQLPVMFYAYDEEKKSVYLYVLSEAADTVYEEYQSAGIDRIEVHVASEVIAQHTAQWAKLNAA